MVWENKCFKDPCFDTVNHKKIWFTKINLRKISKDMLGLFLEETSEVYDKVLGFEPDIDIPLDVNWTYIRHSEDVQGVFSTSYYVQFTFCAQEGYKEITLKENY